MKFDRRLLSHAWLERGALILSIVLGITGSLLVVIQARLLSIIINLSFIQELEIQGLMQWLLILLIIIVLRSIIHFGSEVSSGSLAIRVKKYLRELLLEKLLLLGPTYTQGEESGELIAVVVQGIEALDAYFSQYIPQLILAAFTPLMILMTVFPMDIISGLILLITIPLMPFFLYLVGVAFEKLTSKQWFILSRMSAYFLDSLQGLTTLKILNQSRARIGKIAEISEEYRQATLKVLRATFLSAFILELTSTISTALVAVQIGLRLLNGKFGFEYAFFILLVTPEFYLPLRLLGMRFHAGMSGVSAAKRIFSILEQPPINQIPVQNGITLPGDGKMEIKRKEPKLTFNIPVDQLMASTQRQGSIRFDHVIYSYPDREESALKDTTFSINFGEITALVGKSGAGKTTIARILMKHIQPISGQIMIQDMALGDIHPQDWRKHIAWVPQNPYLFHDTVIANILIGCPSANLDDVRKAAQESNLLQDIETLPKGFSSIIGEGGARLSAGQRQRLALARAYLRNAPIIILDEPGEHFDPEQEVLFGNSLQKLFLGRTVILIAHYIPTIMLANNVIVMDKGRIVETGTHHSLIQSKGVYHQLVSHWMDWHHVS